MRKRDDEKQKNIKEAVIKVILREGFHGASISKIAKEAEVSPATVYIYYENKELMLQCIFREYSEDIINYILEEVDENMEVSDFIEKLIRIYYKYIRSNEEVFNFIEQFSSCPALVKQCSTENIDGKLNELLDNYKSRGAIRPIRNKNLMAVIFSPVKTIAGDKCISEEEKEALLVEITDVIKRAVLV